MTVDPKTSQKTRHVDIPSTEIRTSSSAPAWNWVVLALVAMTVVGISYTILQVSIPSEAKGGLACLLMLILLLIKVPVAVAMGLSGGLGILALGGSTALTNTLGDLPYDATASFTLSVLPMFIFMGIMLWRSGVTSELYLAARHWVGWLPGGLSVTTTVAGAGLASASGSTIGITYALGRIGIPEMLRAGYDRRLAIGSVMVAGTIGQLIPPSIYAVVFAGFAEIAVGPQLLAGILPGILLKLVYALLIIGFVLMRPQLVSKRGREVIGSSTWRDRWEGLASIWVLPALIVLVIGGLYLGVFTATEAGAVGSLGAVVIAAARLGFKDFVKGVVDALRDTVASVGSILFLLMGAAILNRLLALSGAARWFADVIEGAGLGRVGFICMLVLIYLVLGMFMEPISMMLLTVPVLLPVAIAVGIEPMWYGVFFILMAEISILTPPVGILVFITHRLAQDPEVRGDTQITLWDVFQGALWFVPGALFVVALITAFPAIVDFIPNLGAAK